MRQSSIIHQGRQHRLQTRAPALALLLQLLLFLGTATTANSSPPELQGRHLRITALQEDGFLNIMNTREQSTEEQQVLQDVDQLTYSGYLIDMIQALAQPQRANFTYTLVPPTGYGSLCSPRLSTSNDTTSTSTTSSNNNNPHLSPFDSIFWTQYNCGASDVTDGPSTPYASDMYLGMYYITPTRQLLNQFTMPFAPPFSGTLAMFGTATGIPDFPALVQQQLAGLQGPACAPAGTALIDFLPQAYPGLQVQGITGGPDEIYQAFFTQTCQVYITDGPIAAQFVLRASRRQNQCTDRDGRPIGVIGNPMEFGLSHYAMGIRQDIDPHVVDTLSYWINVLMSCNPRDPQGLCPEGNLATMYAAAGGDGTECGYVLYPTSDDSLSTGVITAIVLASVVFVVILYSLFHLHRLKIQQSRFRKKEAFMQQLAQRERDLNEFVAHEIRNPLASAIAGLQFVRLKAADEALVPIADDRQTLKDDLNIVDSSLQFVNELLRNMLDLHRSTDAKLRLHWAPTDILLDVLEPVVSIVFMRGARVDVKAECEPSNLMVQADRMRLKQICLNLATNAAKFVEQGYITLRARVEYNNNPHDKSQDDSNATDDQKIGSMRKVTSSPSSSEQPNVVIEIEDSGPGIPADKRENLFVKFQESLDVLNQGTGIGLSVCKSLSDLMGASLSLDDEFDSGIPGCKGTRFVLRLNQPPLEDLESDMANGEDGVNHKPPVRRSSSTTGVAAMPAALTIHPSRDNHNNPHMETHGRPPYEPLASFSSVGAGGTGMLPEKMSILFVDDDSILRKMFSRTLKMVAPEGWVIREASNGETAIRLTVDEGERFDIMFVDHYMAGHNKQLLGTETIRTLRANGITGIICGLSANDKEDEFREAGADAFMFKPFPCEKKALRRALWQVIHSRDSSSEALNAGKPLSVGTEATSSGAVPSIVEE